MWVAQQLLDAQGVRYGLELEVIRPSIHCSYAQR